MAILVSGFESVPDLPFIYVYMAVNVCGPLANTRTRHGYKGIRERDHTYARRIVDQAVVRRQAETSLFEPYQAPVNCGMKVYRVEQA